MSSFCRIAAVMLERQPLFLSAHPLRGERRDRAAEGFALDLASTLATIRHHPSFVGSDTFGRGMVELTFAEVKAVASHVTVERNAVAAVGIDNPDLGHWRGQAGDEIGELAAFIAFI